MDNEMKMVQIFSAPLVTVCSMLKDICIEKGNDKEERIFEFGDVIFTLSCELKGEDDAE